MLQLAATVAEWVDFWGCYGGVAEPTGSRLVRGREVNGRPQYPGVGKRRC